MKKTKEISVGYELFTTVLLLITGMMLLILLSISMNSLISGTQRGKMVLFICLMITGLETILVLRRLILLPHSWLFWFLILEGIVQVLSGKALPIDDKHFKAIEIFQQATCQYPNTVGFIAIGDSYKKLEGINKTEQVYLSAWHMNPRRFYPKYLLPKLYDENGQKEKAVITAKESLGKQKQVKIESIIVEEIRVELEGTPLKRQSFIKEGNSTMSHPEFKLQKW